MITKIHSYYVNGKIVVCGDTLENKDIAEMILKNNISEFNTDIPIYDSLEEYGITADSIRTPNKNEYFNYIKKIRKQENAKIK
jgi:hypothetical protein